MKIQTRDKQTTIELDADNEGNIILSVNGVTAKIPNELENDVLFFMMDGTCPICRDPIPENDEICCECLERIQVHHLGHGCC